MTISFSRPRAKPILSLCVFLVVFSAVAILYIQKDHARDIRQFRIHATIIADDVWAVNPSGAEPYLRLVLQANSFKNLSVRQQGGEPFVQVDSPALAGLDRLLERLQLIRTKNLATEIIYNGQRIGSLQGKKYVQVIYPLVNILIFLLLITLTVVFFINLFSNRRYLEQQVGERTRNLRESERRFHDLVNLLPEMVWEADQSGRVTYANKIAIRRLGLSDFPDTPIVWFDFIVPVQRESVVDYFAESLQGIDLGLREFRAAGRNGESIPILLRSAPILLDQTITGARTIAIDISERHTLEEQLRRAQKMKAIGLMAGGVAHDLNNILSGVVNYPELMLMDLPQDSPLRHPLEIMRRSGLQAAEVVADLLTVARGVAATKIVSDLHSLISEYLESPEFLELVSYSPKITLITNFGPDTGHISCSPIHVKKCLMNLVTNAAEAISGAGTITITTSKRSIDKNQSNRNTLPAGDYTVLAVQDSGSGILPQDLKHIFEPFYTKKTMGRSGTGLGLAVVWNTMIDHEGTVIVTSDQNGTTFDLYFPSTNETPAIQPEDASPAAFRGNGQSILVVDDEEQQRDIADQLLTVLGYKVTTVSSGEEAVILIQETAVDLIILDMIMPPGMNGRQTYEKIIAIRPGQRAIIVSGYSENVEVKAALRLGAGGFISKPYTLAQLGRTIHNLIRI
jgi:two-component system, cell cycle sensor histidine kinase and response regulator CckA